MEHTKGKLKFIYSPKHPRAIFIKVRDTKDKFVCKVYSQATHQETQANAEIIFEAFERMRE